MCFRLFLVHAICVFLVGTLINDSVYAQKGKHNKPPAKRKVPHEPTQGDRNKISEVAGAIWTVKATNEKTGEVKAFGFRANNGTLYDDTGKIVGTIKPQERGVSVLSWTKVLPLEGNIKITCAKIGHWGGVMKTKEGEWNCQLQCVDR